ncbi:hypothetical protein [Dyadobacter sp.]|uniref:hypothetical protein n=1 Tax=Dyadobacter sp. TaxID=1914288 RepID=UPI003F70F291
MDIAKHLEVFFKNISADARITVTHISVFTAILQATQKLGTNCLTMFSFELMQVAKISSGKTYYKAMRELNDFGYIMYEPSFNKNRPSRIVLPEPLI